MSRMLKREKEEAPITRFGAAKLVIRDVPYDNSAAKFWSSLMDEVAQDYPDCDTLVISSSSSQALSKRLLYPQAALQRDFDDLLDMDLDQVIRETLEELELNGMPSGVTVVLMVGGRELATVALPGECADAAVFAYLVSWLLEWSDVREADWNNDSLSAKISAADTARNLRYDMDVDFLKEHLSEGLYRRSVTIRFSRRGQKG